MSDSRTEQNGQAGHTGQTGSRIIRQSRGSFPVLGWLVLILVGVHWPVPWAEARGARYFSFTVHTTTGQIKAIEPKRVITTLRPTARECPATDLKVLTQRRALKIFHNQGPRRVVHKYDIGGDRRNKVIWQCVSADVVVAALRIFDPEVPVQYRHDPGARPQSRDRLLAFDRKGWRLLWSRDWDHADSYQQIAPDILLVTGQRLQAMNLRTGDDVWRPVALQGRLVWLHRLPDGSWLLQGGQHLCRVDGKTGQERWRAESHHHTPLVLGNAVFDVLKGSPRGNVRLVQRDLATGKVIRDSSLMRYSAFYDQMSLEVHAVNNTRVRVDLVFYVLD